MIKKYINRPELIVISALIIFFLCFIVKKGFGGTMPDYAPGSLIVKFSSNTNYQIRTEKNKVITGIGSIDSLNSAFHAKSFKPYYFELFNPTEDKKLGKDRMFVFQFPANADLEYIADIYKKDQNVEEAYPNYLYVIHITPNDPYYNSQWALPKISASSAWDIHQGSSSVVIGIIDTGVDLDHPDLQSKLISSNLWRDEVDINTSYYESLGYELDPNEDYTTSDNVPQDRGGHGTHVAGIASAATNNSIGIAGLAYNCKIMPLRAGFRIKNPYGYWVGILESDDWGRVLDWARNKGTVKIINMSFGSSNASNQSNIAAAYNSGMTLIAASGNNNSSNEHYPAAFNNYVIAVGATDENDSRCDPGDWGSGNGSNYGSWLDVVAPR